MQTPLDETVEYLPEDDPQKGRAPGWYPDPLGDRATSRSRWWTGIEWGDETYPPGGPRLPRVRGARPRVVDSPYAPAGVDDGPYGGTATRCSRCRRNAPTGAVYCPACGRRLAGDWREGQIYSLALVTFAVCGAVLIWYLVEQQHPGFLGRLLTEVTTPAEVTSPEEGVLPEEVEPGPESAETSQGT